MSDQSNPSASLAGINPSRIMQVGTAFMASKTMLTAVNIGLFTQLAQGPLSGKEIASRSGLHQRGLYDFLDTLVSLGFLKRDGILDNAKYSNAPDTDMFLDNNKRTYIGGILEMIDHRLYGFWGNLEEGLKTGQPQNEIKETGANAFEALYSNEAGLQEFLSAMAGIQMGNFMAFAKGFDFSKYNSLCDMGGAGGFLAAQVAMNNPGISCTSFDLPQVEKVAKGNLAAMGLSDKVKVVNGNFFENEFPRADVITMGNILHDWGLEEKKTLIKKAFQALPAGGSFVAIENVIDRDRRVNTFGMLMSLNMLIETADGFDYTETEFESWAKEAGFREVRFMPLTGPTSAAVAVK